MSCVVPIAVLAHLRPTNGGSIVDLLLVSDGHVPTSLPCSGRDRGDDFVVPLGGGHVNHLGKVLGLVAGNGKDELSYSLSSTF